MSHSIIDPRIKLLSMLFIALIALTGTTVGHGIYLRLIILLIPSLCLLYLRYFKSGLLCFLVLLLGWYIESFQLRNYHAVIYSFIFMSANLITRFLPAAILGFLLFKTTSVEMFMAALEKMKCPRIITIPLAVMFRFIPVVVLERQNIKYAMQMRGITWLRPMRYIEMRVVPLMNRMVKLSNELTTASLTRGLSTDTARSYVIVLKLTMRDRVIASVLSLIVFIYYLI